MKIKHELLILLAGIYVVIAAQTLLGHEPTEEQRAQAYYCEMVHMHQRDPSTGWPDFHHTYDSECTNGKPKAR